MAGIVVPHLNSTLGHSMKYLVQIAALVAFACVHSAQACRPNPDPMWQVSGPVSLKDYERIYVGVVVSVRLTSYISELRQTDGDGGEVTIIGGSMPFDFEVFPQEFLKGSAEGPQRESSGGCSIAEAKLRDQVLVFQMRGGATSFRVLGQGNFQADERYISHIRKCLAGTCLPTQWRYLK